MIVCPESVLLTRVVEDRLLGLAAPEQHRPSMETFHQLQCLTSTCWILEERLEEDGERKRQ